MKEGVSIAPDNFIGLIAKQGAGSRVDESDQSVAIDAVQAIRARIQDMAGACLCFHECCASLKDEFFEMAPVVFEFCLIPFAFRNVAADGDYRPALSLFVV